MLLTLVLWIPLVLVVVSIRLVIFEIKLAKKLALSSVKELKVNTNREIRDTEVGSDVIERTKDKVTGSELRARSIVGRAGSRTGSLVSNVIKSPAKIVEHTKKTVKVSTGATKTVAKGITMTAKLLIRFIKALVAVIQLLASFIVSMGLAGIVIVSVVVVLVVGGGVLSIFWDDTINVKVASNNQTRIVNRGTSSKSVSMDLAELDVGTIKYKPTYCSKKQGVRTNLSRDSVTKLANLLLSKENSFKSKSGENLCKYIGYEFGALHGDRAYMWDVDSRVNYLKANVMTSYGVLHSKCSGTTDMRAGLFVKDNKAFHADCSTFVTWFYATLFSAYDRDNKDFKTLANWFYGITSQVQTYPNTVTKISRKDLKPGDICNNGHHITIYIGNNKVVHDSGMKSGVKISSNTYEGFYRPNFKFADD